MWGSLALALAGLFACPGAPAEETGRTPHTYDTGWALYEAPGEGWSELQPLDGDGEVLVLDPDGRPTASACRGMRHCADGGCRESCADSPGWYEPLGPLRMLAVAYPAFDDGGSNRPAIWLVNDAEGRAWRRSSAEPPVPERVPDFDAATSMGGVYAGTPARENACWCATFADRPAACGCAGVDVPSELSSLAGGATHLWSSGWALAALDAEGAAAALSYVSGWLQGELPHAPYSALGVATLMVIGLTPAGEVEVYGIPSIPGDDEAAEPRWGPAASGAMLAGASWTGTACWVDEGARVHFMWYGWTEEGAQEPSEWPGEPILGPQLEAVPSALACGHPSGCALVEGRLQCWTQTYDGTLSYLYFESLMTTSGTRLR